MKKTCNNPITATSAKIKTLSMNSSTGQTNHALVIGASSGIADALIAQLLQDETLARVTAISRSSCPEKWIDDPRLCWRLSHYDEPAITVISQQLLEQNKITPLHIDRVFICNGILHSEDFNPEKRVEELDAKIMQRVFLANTIIPALWLKTLRPLLTGKKSCHMVFLSARVGSINDNRMGGWYSYRASKAALNMLLKTAAIEYARRAKNVKLIAFHPGTTDTALSKPFQKNIPEDKLFTPDFVARQLLMLVAKTPIDGTLSYLDWDHQSIDW